MKDDPLESDIRFYSRDVRTALTPLSMLFLAEAAAAAALFSVPILAPMIAGELGIPSGRIGGFSGLFFFAAAFSSLISSTLVARFGAIGVTQAGLIGTGASLAATILGMVPIFALSGLAMGFSYGLLTPAASAVLVRHTPLRLVGPVFSIKQTGNPVGGAIAGLLVPVCATAFGWRIANIIMASLCVALAALISIMRRRYNQRSPQQRPPRVDAILTPLRLMAVDRRLRALALIGLPFGAIQTCLGAFLVVYLVESVGFSLIKAGSLMTLTQSAGMLGRIGWGAISGPLLPGAVVLGILGIGMGLSAAAIALLTSYPLPTLVVIACAMLGMTGTGWSGAYMAEVARQSRPEIVATATGGASSFCFIGAAAGPLAFSAITASTGSYAIGFLFIGAACGIPALYFFATAPDLPPDKR